MKRAEGVTKVLSDRSDQINSLIVDGNELFGELERRRDAINELIVNTSAVTSVVRSGPGESAQMGPTLDNLNQAVAVLQRNKQNIADALDGLGPYIAHWVKPLPGTVLKAYVSNILPSMWWKTALDAGLAPDQLPQDLQDLIPESKPYTREPGNDLRLDRTFGIDNGRGRRRECLDGVHAADGIDRGHEGRAASVRKWLVPGLVIALVAAVGLGAAVFLLPGSEEHRVCTLRLHDGSLRGDDVRVLGVNVGTVEKIEPGENDAKVTMYVGRRRAYTR